MGELEIGVGIKVDGVSWDWSYGGEIGELGGEVMGSVEFEPSCKSKGGESSGIGGVAVLTTKAAASSERIVFKQRKGSSKRVLHGFVKWPKVVRIQRQRRILKQRLKVPPALNQFTKTLNKNLATNLFKMLLKYGPEDKATKKERFLKGILKRAQAEEREIAEGKFLAIGSNTMLALENRYLYFIDAKGIYILHIHAKYDPLIIEILQDICLS
ncbi:60S ribosomal protein L7a-1-like [Amborella trichopoda]|uniref:60S ribosomal protein L7a-1-like n=1 Tax=Amborella trichopoda TaxID=13333 RepID=UPI0005D3988C|nr:60S ribosomal protein L7a-1-like [Amborella trichopoda]|eukprot:XP_011623751.1 60S ribosomal protein L7a-1-like [Amborella trichopoda]